MKESEVAVRKHGGGVCFRGSVGLGSRVGHMFVGKDRATSHVFCLFKLGNQDWHVVIWGPGKGGNRKREGGCR